MNIFIYASTILLLALFVAVLVRKKGSEMFKVWYCLISPIGFGGIYYAMPFMSDAFKRWVFESDRYPIFSDFAYVVLHLMIFTPVMIMMVYALNLIVLHVKLRSRKKQLPEDHFDKW